MTEKYSYSITDDFLNSAVDSTKLIYEVDESNITRKLDYIGTDDDNCDIWFLDTLTSGDETILDGLVAFHDGEPLPVIEPPTMADGRPIVRSDTRPLDTQTYFTMYGDSASGVGDGKGLIWDFSNNDDLYDPSDMENGPEIPDGYKAKRIDLVFNKPIYSKDGALYFFDAPWGSMASLCITVPAGNYYPNSAGSIPAVALGLSGSQMYAYATKDVFYSCYVNKHHMCGTCVFGDELNSEGSSVDALPIGWYITGIVFTPIDDITSKGYGSFEIYKERSILLPGETV